jgi:hypothetical protein
MRGRKGEGEKGRGCERKKGDEERGRKGEGERIINLL